jgi:VWFA-related protein
VLDRSRSPVLDLTAADFTVEVNGKTASVEVFTPVRLPPAEPEAAPWTREIAPGVATNQLSGQGRLVAVLIDYELDIPMTVLVRKIARQVIESLAPTDMAAVLYLWQARPQNFTSDRSRLLAAIEQPYMPLTNKPPGFCWCDVCRLDTTTAIVDALQSVPQRRKEIVYIGSRFRFQGGGECATPLKDARNRLFRALDLGNVTVHSVDPAGLQTRQATAESRRPIGPDGLTQHQLDLGVLPRRTSGRVVTNTNDPDRDVPSIIAEGAAYYILGVERPAARPDGRDQNIEVKVRRRGVSVSTRRAYAASSTPENATAGPTRVGEPPRSLIEAIEPVWPIGDIPIRTTAAAFAAPGSEQASVVVVSEVRQPWNVPAAGTSQVRTIGVLAGSWDRNGRPIATHTKTLSVEPVLAGSGTGTELRYQVGSRLSLPPGVHEIRFAVEDHGSGTRGSVYADLDVPAFSDDPLSLSGLLAGAAPAPPLEPAELFNDLLPIIPTALREFSRASRVAAFVRAYQGGDDPPRDVTMSATLLGVSETPIHRETTTLAAARFARTRSTDYLIEVPVAQLAPGPYLLTLEASLHDKRVTRHMRFEMK